MISGSRSFLVLSFAALLGAAALVACSAADNTKKKKQPIDPADEFGMGVDDGPEEEPIATQVNEDSGAYGAPERPSHKDAGEVPVDAGVTPVDAGVVTKTFCAGPLAAGDLVITELMIASRAGSADDGEWVEIRSTRDCWLTLDGVTVESPRGTATTDVATLPAGVALGPGASFVVADSADPTKSHGIAGVVFAWDASDVLKNGGDTVSVKLGATVVDTLTYPAFTNLTPGRSLAFPSDCTAADRADWQRWSLAFTAFAPGFQGTPNAPNADVACF